MSERRRACDKYGIFVAVTPVTLVQARQGKAHADGVAFRPAGLQLEMDTRYSTKKLYNTKRALNKSTAKHTL